MFLIVVQNAQDKEPVADSSKPIFPNVPVVVHDN